MVTVFSRVLPNAHLRARLAGTFVSVAGLMILSPAYSMPVDINAGLIHHWNFDQFRAGTTSGFEDVAGGQHIGDTNGSLTSGKTGNALRINVGNNTAQINPIPSNPLDSGDYSISFWFKANSNTARSNWKIFGSEAFGFNPTNELDFTVGTCAAGNAGCRYNNAIGVGLEGSTFYAHKPFTVGNWHHMSLSYDESENKSIATLDGVEATRRGVTYNVLPTNPALGIGRYTQPFSDLVNADLDFDELRIYDRVINDAEIAVLSKPETELPFIIGDPKTRRGSGGLTGYSVVGSGADGEALTGSINQNLPSIVLTHGWQPNGDFAQDRFPMEKVELAIQKELSGKGISANILKYRWEDAYTDTFLGAPIAMAKTDNHGVLLANALENFTEDIHFVGHSYGTLVNAYAIDQLPDDFAVAQFTLLDSPETTRLDSIPVVGPLVGRAAGVDYSKFEQLLDTSKVSYVDNYFTSNLLGNLPGFGNTLEGSAPNGGVDVNPFYESGNGVGHSEIQSVFYSDWIASNSDLSGTADFRSQYGDWVSALDPETYENRPSPQSWSKPAGLLTELLDLGVGIGNGAWDVVTGSAQTINDLTSCGYGSVTVQAICLTELSPSGISHAVDVPIATGLFSFEFGFGGIGDGDWLTLHFGDELLWSFLGTDYDGDDLMRALISVEHLAGLSGTFYFTLNSVGEANAQISLANFQFLGSAQVGAPSMPMIMLLACVMLYFCRSKSVKSGTEGTRQ